MTVGGVLATVLGSAAGMGMALLLQCDACAHGGSPPVTPAADVDSGCATLDAITASRLIRTADGSPLVIHCDAGSP